MTAPQLRPLFLLLTAVVLLLTTESAGQARQVTPATREFGYAEACREVGGALDRSILSSLGGSALGLMCAATILAAVVTAGSAAAGGSDRLSRTEAAARDNQGNFRTFFETVDDLIVVATPAGKIVYANPAVSRKLRYSMSELQRMAILDLHRPEDHAQAARILAEMLRGERRCCPLPLRTSDGRLLPVETRVWLGTWDGQEALFGICKDLSEQQAALQMFQTVFDGNPTPMALSHLPDRFLIKVNRAFTEITGYEPEEALGKTSLELRLFAEPEESAFAAEQLAQRGRVSGAALTLRTKSGTLRQGLFFGEVVHSQGEEYFLSTMIDITAQKRTELELREAQETLERRVQERTTELRAANTSLVEENARRRRAEDALAEHGRQLRQLASRLALTEEKQRHELAVQLHDTIGQELAMARLRLEHCRSRSPADLTPHFAVAAKLLDDAIGQVQAVTHDLGSTVLHELGVPAALRSLGSRLAEQHGLVFEYHQQGAYQRVGRDWELQLYRAVRELAFNVVKHAQASRLEFGLQLSPSEFVVRVADNGRGFVPELELHRTRLPQGGFGLFSIREQLAALGGRLDLESRPGLQTVATVTLPVPSHASDEGQAPT